MRHVEISKKLIRLLSLLPFLTSSYCSFDGNAQQVASSPIFPKPLVPLEGMYFPAVYFEVGSSQVSERQKLFLDSMGLSFRRVGILRLVLTGHTDKSGSDRVNQRLSVERARHVAAELTKLGFAPNDLRVVGVGSGQPRFPANHPEPKGERFVLLQDDT